ncbi:MAG TPA: hypothetical protein GX520_10595 [Syntrophaceticus sp.]|jgi:hypothetical protein|nr:hypothetical protein [Syntrophaceticus sp.]
MDKMNVIIDNIEKSMENYREFNGINEDIERYADLSREEFNSIEWFLLYSPDGDNEISAVRSGFKKIVQTFQRILSSKKI